MPIRALYLARQLLAERQPREALKRTQLHHLRHLVYESYKHTASYRCFMQRSGVRPDEIKSLDDIERLPVIGKANLLEFSEEERTNRRHEKDKGFKRILTSGSSGVPFEFDIDQQYDKWRKSQFLRPYVTNGRQPWHSVLRLTSSPTNRSGLAARFRPYKERQIACSSSVSSQLSELQRDRPIHVQGFPSALRCMAFEMLTKGISTPYVQKVFTDSELLTPDTRTLIERAFGSPVIDVYGTLETDNIAYQCSSTSDYHVTIDSVIAECHSSGTAQFDKDGELVVTVLRNYTTPFIRYNLGDVVRLLSSQCACGRTFPLMKIVAGRSDDLIWRADGKRQSPMPILFNLDLSTDFIREYQIAQTGIDSFVTRVVPLRPLTGQDQENIRAAITAEIPNAHVEVASVDRIPRSAASKFKVFVCEIRSGNGIKHGN